MIAAIDFGNSTVKVGLFKGSKLHRIYRQISPESLPKVLKQHQPGQLVLSDVTGKGEKAIEASGFGSLCLKVHHKLDFPFKNFYKTPETLGVDRLAAVAGASFIYPGNDCLIIDIGTCITYDFLSADSAYLGGGISPGWRLRFKAMNQYTAKLPMLNELEDSGLIGQTTQVAMQSGVINGIVGEIDGWADKLRQQYPMLKVLLCGGDATTFESKVKPPIFAHPDLVLFGLNRILQENAFLP